VQHTETRLSARGDLGSKLGLDVTNATPSEVGEPLEWTLTRVTIVRASPGLERIGAIQFPWEI
jgi:hypothetical protein